MGHQTEVLPACTASIDCCTNDQMPPFKSSSTLTMLRRADVGASRRCWLGDGRRPARLPPTDGRLAPVVHDRLREVLGGRDDELANREPIQHLQPVNVAQAGQHERNVLNARQARKTHAHVGPCSRLPTARDAHAPSTPRDWTPARRSARSAAGRPFRSESTAKS